MASFKQISLNCSGHTRPVVHLEFSDITECGYFLISACKDGKPMLRQGETGDWIGTFEGHKGAVWGVALNGPATLAASGAADFTAKLWDAMSGDAVHTFEHDHIVKCVNFSKDNKMLVTASNEKLIRVFDLSKPEAGAVIKLSGHTNSIRHANFLHGDSRIVSVGDDGTMRIWDRLSGQEIQKIDFPSIPNSLEVSKDGNTLTVSHGSVISFFSADNLQRIQDVPVPTKCYSASLHPEGAVFVCGGEDLKVYKFDVATGLELESNKGHFGPVHCIRFSPDGELYASGSEDGTVRMWQTVVGTTYGLWKRTEGAAAVVNNASGNSPNSQQSANSQQGPNSPTSESNPTLNNGLKEVAAI